MAIAERRAPSATAILEPADGAPRTDGMPTGEHLFVVGAGYVGLVTSVGMARLGHRVTLADVNPRKIAALREGRVPIYEPGLAEALAEVGERITFTTDSLPPAGVKYTFLAVGTPLSASGQMDLGNVKHCVRDLLAAKGPDHVIVVRSTLTPEAPEALQRLRTDIEGGPALVTNPEFLREGSALDDFARPDRIVTGWLSERDKAAAESVLDLYAGIDAPTFVADARSVALVKIASNVYLAMKIAYANELARLCEAFGANASVVADGMGLDARIGRAFLDAGPGIGGSCLPEQAVALAGITQDAGVAAPLIRSVAVSNDVHQAEIARRLEELLTGGLRGARVALLGLAFKANTDDVRQSPALAIAAHLRKSGATVVGTDPQAAATARRADAQLEVAASVLEAAADADAVLVATEWPEYRSLDWKQIAAAMRGSVVFDTRAVVDALAVVGAGLQLERLGRPHRADAKA